MTEYRISSDLKNLIEEHGGMLPVAQKISDKTGLNIQTSKEWLQRISNPHDSSFVGLANKKLAPFGCELAIVKKQPSSHESQRKELSRLKRFKQDIQRLVTQLKREEL